MDFLHPSLPYALKLWQSIIVRGIPLIGTEEIAKVLLHADDATFLVQDGKSAKEILNILKPIAQRQVAF